MLAMLGSVPEKARSDARFKRALILAGHLAVCRENWLDRMAGDGRRQAAWWPRASDLDRLRARFARVETRWSEYLTGLGDEDLDVDFEFPVTGGGYRWNIEGQIFQLVGHAYYHRGQIALLVDELGGKAEDTDYLYWAVKRSPERWKRI